MAAPSIQTSSKAVDVKLFLGLTNSHEDKDRWQDFLRVSKAIHDDLHLDPIPWGDLPWEIKAHARSLLEDRCRQENLFGDHGLNDVVNWRFYHLQKASKSNLKKGDVGKSLDGEAIPAVATSSAAPPTISESPQPQDWVKVPSRPYDPVKDSSYSQNSEHGT